MRGKDICFSNDSILESSLFCYYSFVLDECDIQCPFNRKGKLEDQMTGPSSHRYRARISGRGKDLSPSNMIHLLMWLLKLEWLHDSKGPRALSVLEGHTSSCASPLPLENALLRK
jgi:hypothetical protein